MTWDEEMAALIDASPDMTAMEAKLLSLLHPGRTVPWSFLVEQMWPDDPSRDVENVQNHLRRLRKHVPEGMTITTRTGMGLRLDVPSGWKDPRRTPHPTKGEMQAALDMIVGTLRPLLENITLLLDNARDQAETQGLDWPE